MVLHKVGDKYELLSHDGKVLMHATSLERAKQHEREVEYFKHKGRHRASATPVGGRYRYEPTGRYYKNWCLFHCSFARRQRVWSLRSLPLIGVFLSNELHAHPIHTLLARSTCIIPSKTTNVGALYLHPVTLRWHRSHR